MKVKSKTAEEGCPEDGETGRLRYIMQQGKEGEHQQGNNKKRSDRGPGKRVFLFKQAGG